MKWAPTNITLPGAGKQFWIKEKSLDYILAVLTVGPPTPCVEVWCGPQNTFNKPEHFTLEYTPDGFCRILAWDGRSIWALFGLGDGEKLYTSPTGGTSRSDKWLIADAGGGYFYLVNVAADKCMRFAEGDIGPVLGPKAPELGRMWRFEPV